jgi:histidinol-phosphate aminotransferase
MHAKTRPASDGDGPAPLPGLDQLTRYQPGKRTLAPGATAIKLSSNESAFGPSPAAVAAYHAVAGELHRYADASQRELREAIAGVYGIPADRIVCGNGSDEIIDLLIRAFVAPGQELLLSENHFAMCAVHGRTQGARIVLAPERGFDMDVDALLARVTPHTRMVALANPNNPTGTYLPRAEIARLHAGLPAGVLLLLDGAYADYVTAADFDAGFGLAATAPNVVVTHTFSKIYGLAGLRIGWAFGPSRVIDVLERIRSPFNASAAAQAAATAAVRDQDFVRRAREHNARWLARLRAELEAAGLHVVPSVANFYLLRFGGDRNAAGAAAWLEARGIIPRVVLTGDAENVLRISVGTDAENEAVIAALTAFMQELNVTGHK